jgi:ApaG protein
MITKTSSGVSISVSPKFKKELSSIEEGTFVFEYHITIENLNSDLVKLLSREWFIFDSLNEPYYVKGSGVVGEQPLLKYKQQHTYYSFCELKSEIGYMEGNYTFLNISTNQTFKVLIPRFQLIYPAKNN